MLTTVWIIKYLFSMNNYFVKVKVTKNLTNLPKKFCEFPRWSFKGRGVHKIVPKCHMGEGGRGPKISQKSVRYNCLAQYFQKSGPRTSFFFIQMSILTPFSFGYCSNWFVTKYQITLGRNLLDYLFLQIVAHL